MQLTHAIFFGIFILILAYLGVKNANGVVAIFNSGGGVIQKESTILQGR